jgi:hypothetical protein
MRQEREIVIAIVIGIVVIFIVGFGVALAASELL